MDIRAFAQKVLVAVGIVTGLILLLLILWNIIQVLLLVFGGILFAVFLRGTSSWLSQVTKLPIGISLFLVVLAVLSVIGISFWRLGPSVATQINELIDQMPQLVTHLKGQLEKHAWARGLVHQIPSPDEWVTNFSNILNEARVFFSTTFGFLASSILILFVGLYLSANPELYVEGIVRLVPHRRRHRTRQVLHTVGFTLHWWLIGRSFDMVLVGTMSGLGLWLLNIPLALTFGLLAGFLTFIPYIGPLVSAVPPILLALPMGSAPALYVILLYIGIHTLDSYVVTPLVQQQTVLLPPVLTLIVQIAFGMLFGLLGVLLATPLSAVGLVLVKMLYIEDVLKDVAKVGGGEPG
ncbi:MAG: AI-2E family transporter [Desulfoferrobacter sp.]